MTLEHRVNNIEKQMKTSSCAACGGAGRVVIVATPEHLRGEAVDTARKRCPACGRVALVVQSLVEITDNPDRPHGHPQVDHHEHFP